MPNVETLTDEQLYALIRELRERVRTSKDQLFALTREQERRELKADAIVRLKTMPLPSRTALEEALKERPQ